MNPSNKNQSVINRSNKGIKKSSRKPTRFFYCVFYFARSIMILLLLSMNFVISSGCKGAC